jgi:hypothetical protein
MQRHQRALGGRAWHLDQLRKLSYTGGLMRSEGFNQLQSDLNGSHDCLVK